MLIAATGLTVAALAASPLVSRPLVSAPSPIVADVTIAAKVSPALVNRILDEASAIWRKAGFTILWQRTDPAQVVRSSPAPEASYVPARLRVIIGDARGVRRDSGVPLGWVLFDDTNTPGPEIYLSNANAHQLLAESVKPQGAIERMPRAEQETLLGRALGRALAHELGHYLLSSKHHTERGLMQARLMAPQLFSPSRERFTVDVTQHDLIAARLAPPLLVGRAANP
jgi:hypothetical protein